MVLRASMLQSATNFTDYYKHGVTLKSRTLKSWIKKKGYTQAFVAELLGMSKRKFRRKLYRRQRFNQKEITALIFFMGARAAIRVIWFPSLQEKRRIQKYVWEGQMSYKYDLDFPHHFETPSERKQREISELYEESGENWEQSKDYEDLIFDSDELPSRRFMRRRNNG